MRCQAVFGSVRCPVEPQPGKTHSLLPRLGSDLNISTTNEGSGSKCERPALVIGRRQMRWSKSISAHRADRSSFRRVPSSKLNGKYARQYSFGSCDNASLTRRSSSGDRKRSRFSSRKDLRHRSRSRCGSAGAHRHAGGTRPRRWHHKRSYKFRKIEIPQQYQPLSRSHRIIRLRPFAQ